MERPTRPQTPRRVGGDEEGEEERRELSAAEALDCCRSHQSRQSQRGGCGREQTC